MNGEARRFEHGLQVGRGRALAVGAGDMDDRRELTFGMAQPLQQPLHAAQGKVDALGMERFQPLQDALGGARGHELFLIAVAAAVCLVLEDGVRGFRLRRRLGYLFRGGQGGGFESRGR